MQTVRPVPWTFAVTALLSACVSVSQPDPRKSAVDTAETGGIEDSGEGDSGPAGDSTLPAESGPTDSGPTDSGTGEWECSMTETEADAPVTAAEVASTPRDDEAAEWVALQLTAGMIADEADYQRLTADFDAVRALYPEVWIPYWSYYQDLGVYGHLTPDAREAYEAGMYHGWDCLNAFYRILAAQVYEVNGQVSFHFVFSGRYDGPLLAKEYKKHASGTTDVTAPFTFREGAQTHACVESETRWSYVFEDRWDTCGGGGCVYYTYYHIASDAGVLEYIGTHSTDSGEPEPDWLTVFRACSATL